MLTSAVWGSTATATPPSLPPRIVITTAVALPPQKATAAAISTSMSTADVRAALTQRFTRILVY
jgi:hypothetical protein